MSDSRTASESESHSSSSSSSDSSSSSPASTGSSNQSANLTSPVKKPWSSSSSSGGSPSSPSSPLVSRLRDVSRALVVRFLHGLEQSHAALFEAKKTPRQQQQSLDQVLHHEVDTFLNEFELDIHDHFPGLEKTYHLTSWCILSANVNQGVANVTDDVGLDKSTDATITFATATEHVLCVFSCFLVQRKVVHESKAAEQHLKKGKAVKDLNKVVQKLEQNERLQRTSSSAYNDDAPVPPSDSSEEQESEPLPVGSRGPPRPPSDTSSSDSGSGKPLELNASNEENLDPKRRRRH